jgi:hypothetical protein
MKYVDIYLRTTTKKEFVKEAMKIFPDVKESTAQRAYSKAKNWLKESQKEIIINLFDDKIKYKPSLIHFFQDVFTLKVHKKNGNRFVLADDLVNVIIKHTRSVPVSVIEKKSEEEEFKISKPKEVYKLPNEAKEELIKPDILKILTIQDMIIRGFKPSRKFLEQYGFSRGEIEWLKENKYIEV